MIIIFFFLKNFIISCIKLLIFKPRQNFILLLLRQSYPYNHQLVCDVMKKRNNFILLKFYLCSKYNLQVVKRRRVQQDRCYVIVPVKNAYHRLVANVWILMVMFFKKMRKFSKTNAILGNINFRKLILVLITLYKCNDVLYQCFGSIKRSVCVKIILNHEYILTLPVFFHTNYLFYFLT